MDEYRGKTVAIRVAGDKRTCSIIRKRASQWRPEDGTYSILQIPIDLPWPGSTASNLAIACRLLSEESHETWQKLRDYVRNRANVK